MIGLLYYRAIKAVGNLGNLLKSDAISHWAVLLFNSTCYILSLREINIQYNDMIRIRDKANKRTMDVSRATIQLIEYVVQDNGAIGKLLEDLTRILRDIDQDCARPDDLSQKLEQSTERLNTWKTSPERKLLEELFTPS